MVAPRTVVLLLVFLSMALAGCTDETFVDYERADPESEGGDLVTFDVPKGTDEATVVFSTKGAPESPGTATLIIQPPGAGFEASSFVYFKELAHGKTDETKIRNLKAGTYNVIIGYSDGYTGPAQVKISGATGAEIPGLGGSFWDVFGVVLALGTVGGGAFLIRRQSSRLNREMERIDETFRELKDDPDACRLELNDANEDLRRQLVQRRIKESHYLILEKRIERHLAELNKSSSTSWRRTPGEQDVLIEME